MSKSNNRRRDPFEPQPRHEDAKGACFWPDTLFVDLSAYPDEFQNFDADFRVWDEGDLGIFVAAAARTHEQIHWLQTVGTSFGRFLAVNRITTGELSDAILRQTSRRDRAILSDARRRGVPPAQRDRLGRLCHSHDYSVTLQSLFDHWWSSVALEHYLVDSRIDLLGPVDPRFMVGLSLRYSIASGLKDVFNAPDDGFLETCRSFGPRDQERRAVLHSGLTVRHIEESAALIEQHLCNEGFARELPGVRGAEYMARATSWTLERFMDDRHSLYTEALTYFCDRVQVDGRRLFELLLLVCDIALNPLIPDDGSPLGLPWCDFHPVCRFERLVAAFDGFQPDLAVVDCDPPATWWLEERARLVARAGLSDGACEPAYFGSFVSTATSLEAPSEYLRGFLATAGRNLEVLRSRFPSAVASPIHTLHAAPDEFISALGSLQGPCFDPPLNIKSFGDGEASKSMTETEYLEALFAVTLRRASYSWLANAGDLNFNGLPTDGAALKAKQASIQRLDQLFEVSV